MAHVRCGTKRLIPRRYSLTDAPLGGPKVVTALRNDVYFAGRRIDTVYDRLGSVVGSGPYTSTYYPYGEQVGGNYDGDAFATYDRNATIGLDYARNRQYASGWGRFTSADPYQASAGLGRPQSWNRYAYVRGNPVSLLDPSGLDDCSSEVNSSGSCGVNGGGGGVDTRSGGGNAGSNDGMEVVHDDLQSGGSGETSPPARHWDPESPHAKLKDAFDTAGKQIGKECAKLLSGGKLSAEDVRAKLNSVDASFEKLKQSIVFTNALDGSGDYTYTYQVQAGQAMNGKILLNQDIYDPTKFLFIEANKVASVNLVEDERIDLGASKLSVDQYWAIYILHELDHILGGLAPDFSNTLDSRSNTKKVFRDCF